MIFYCPNNRTLQIGERLLLPEDEAQHAVKVLRLQSGDAVELSDGNGNFYYAVITNPHHKRCEIEITNCQSQYEKRSFYLHIAIAPTKNIERFEWFVEKATEIGIDEITPVKCRFSERKVLKEERLEKIMISAMKQSKKAYLPKLNFLQDFEKLVKQDFFGKKFIAHCYVGVENIQSLPLQNLYKKGESALVLIGPEGDFSREEVEFAIKNGFQALSLGNSRLRTETAGVVACHSINFMNEK